MRRSRHTALCLIFLMLTFPAATSTAQATTAVDLAIGGSSGSGARDEHSGGSVDATVSLRKSRPRSFEAFVALTGAAEGFGAHGDKCRLTPSGSCAGPLTFRSVSALAGGAYATGLLSAEVAVGPGLYSSNDNISAAGLQVRIQIATPPASSVAFVISGRHAWLPNYRGTRYEVSAATIGLRVRLGSRS
jgi:hypothetical protein